MKNYFRKVAVDLKNALIQNEEKKRNSGIPDTSRYSDLSATKISEKVNIDLPMIVESSRKLADINRGKIKPDQRDALGFKQILNTNDLIAERIKLDAGKILLNTMRKIRRSRSLKNLPSSFLNTYTEGMLVSNPLSMPLEEINPLHLLDQSMRITQMGPGGIPSEQSITPEMQNVHPSEFGFFDALSGPESSRAGVDVRVTYGSKLGSDGKIYQKFLNPKLNKYVWLSQRDLENSTVAFPD